MDLATEWLNKIIHVLFPAHSREQQEGRIPSLAEGHPIQCYDISL